MLRAMFENNPNIRVCPSCSVELIKHFSEVKIFLKLTNQEKELPTAAIVINDRNRMSNLNRGPSIDDSYQASLHVG